MHRTKHRTGPAFALLIAVLPLAACAHESESDSALSGTSWRLASIDGSTAIADHPATIDFAADGEISGHSGCNRFGGKAAIDGSAIETGPLEITEMACLADGVMEQETRLMRLLTGRIAYSVESDGALTMQGGGGHAARFVPAP